MTGSILPETTHVVVDTCAAGAQQAVKPISLMQEVCSKLGGLDGLRLLRRGLVSGQLKLVSPRCCFFSCLLCMNLCHQLGCCRYIHAKHLYTYICMCVMTLLHTHLYYIKHTFIIHYIVLYCMYYIILYYIRMYMRIHQLRCVVCLHMLHVLMSCDACPR